MAKEVVGTVLFTEKEIAKRAKEIGKQISEDFEGEDIIVIAALKGAFVWLSELIKNIDLDVTIDFVKASSYGSSTTSTGVVTIKLEPDVNMYNKNVILVEDIIDTGLTLSKLKDKFLERNPKSLKICAMLDKPSRRTTDITADYLGFSIDDLFVVGFGLDYDEKYRNLPYISYLSE
jgi:hypoxanthine phosphoribosyltransferase